MVVLERRVLFDRRVDVAWRAALLQEKGQRSWKPVVLVAVVMARRRHMETFMVDMCVISGHGLFYSLFDR